MADATPHEPVNKFKENAGSFASLALVFAFAGIGYFKMLVDLYSGAKMDIPGDWMAAMLSLSSAGLGYLIGRHSTAKTGYSQDEYDRALNTVPPAFDNGYQPRNPCGDRYPCPPIGEPPHGAGSSAQSPVAGRPPRQTMTGMPPGLR